MESRLLHRCVGVYAETNIKNVYELNRLCREDDFDLPLSEFVGACLRRLKPYNIIVVSYSNTAMHHNGYIYQACNFIYTGATKQRTDIYCGKNRHSRHYTQEERSNPIREIRSAKNRYVYFCTSDRKLKREWKNALKYKVMPYPKEQNENYKLGTFIKHKLINTQTGEVFYE